MRKLDANLIVVLDAILAEGNLTRAGERIGMTQPAVSASLSRLRNMLGHPILVRSGRRYVLTPEAVSLRPAVRNALVEIERTLAGPRSFDPTTDAFNFEIAATDYAISVLLRPILKRASTEAPHVTFVLSLLPQKRPVAISDLARGEVIIAPSGQGVPGYETRLFSDEYVVITSRNNVLLTDGAITLASLAGMSQVRAVQGGLSTPGDEMLARAGITPRLSVSVGGLVSVPFLVSGTNSFGIVPRRLATQHADHLGLAIASTPIEPLAFTEAAHIHPTSLDDPAISWLMSTLMDVASA